MSCCSPDTANLGLWSPRERQEQLRVGATAGQVVLDQCVARGPDRSAAPISPTVASDLLNSKSISSCRLVPEPCVRRGSGTAHRWRSSPSSYRSSSGRSCFRDAAGDRGRNGCVFLGTLAERVVVRADGQICFAVLCDARPSRYYLARLAIRFASSSISKKLPGRLMTSAEAGRTTSRDMASASTPAAPTSCPYSSMSPCSIRTFGQYVLERSPFPVGSPYWSG